MKRSEYVYVQRECRLLKIHFHPSGKVLVVLVVLLEDPRLLIILSFTLEMQIYFHLESMLLVLSSFFDIP